MKKVKEESMESKKEELVKKNKQKNKSASHSLDSKDQNKTSSKIKTNKDFQDLGVFQELSVRNKNLEQEILELKKKIEENEDFTIRLKAEFDNYRKRVIEEKEKITASAGELILKDFLKIYDSHNKALEVESSDERTVAFLEGFKLIKQEMDKFLEEQKVEISTKVGDDFDPIIHQAIFFEEKDEAEKEKIMEIFQQGYFLNGRLLREAMVKIVKPKSSTSSQGLKEVSDNVDKKEGKTRN